MKKNDAKVHAAEKTEGCNCSNHKCSFYDEKCEQNCRAGDEDDNPYLPYCGSYIPDKKVDFPILRIIENEYFRKGAVIKMKNDKICLIDAGEEIIGQGDTFRGLLENLIFVLC